MPPPPNKKKNIPKSKLVVWIQSFTNKGTFWKIPSVHWPANHWPASSCTPRHSICACFTLRVSWSSKTGADDGILDPTLMAMRFFYQNEKKTKNSTAHQNVDLKRLQASYYHCIVKFQLTFMCVCEWFRVIVCVSGYKEGQKLYMQGKKTTADVLCHYRSKLFHTDLYTVYIRKHRSQHGSFTLYYQTHWLSRVCHD